MILWCYEKNRMKKTRWYRFVSLVLVMVMLFSNTVYAESIGDSESFQDGSSFGDTSEFQDGTEIFESEEIQTSEEPIEGESEETEDSLESEDSQKTDDSHEADESLELETALEPEVVLEPETIAESEINLEAETIQEAETMEFLEEASEETTEEYIEEIQDDIAPDIVNSSASNDDEDKPYLVVGVYVGDQFLSGATRVREVSAYSTFRVGAFLYTGGNKTDITKQCLWHSGDSTYVEFAEIDAMGIGYGVKADRLQTKGVCEKEVKITARYLLSGEWIEGNCPITVKNLKIEGNENAINIVKYAALSQIVYTHFADDALGKNIGELLQEDYNLKEKDTFICAKSGIGATFASLYNACLSDWTYVETKWGLNGFAASLFRTEKGQYVIAYRGTEIVDGLAIGDVVADFCLGVGLSNSQLKDALDYYDDVVKNHPGISIILTGHSLGGGLANYVSVLRGAKAYTFNAPSTLVSAIVSETQSFAKYYDGLDSGLRMDYVNPRDWVGKTGLGDNQNSTDTRNLSFGRGTSGGKVDPTAFIINQSAINGEGVFVAPFHFFNQMLAYNMKKQSVGIYVESYSDSVITSTYNFSLRKGIVDIQDYELGSMKNDLFTYVSWNAYVFGGLGDDCIIGVTTGKGIDTICGGKGNDEVYGTAGQQVYLYTKDDGFDIIYDSAGKDEIRLYDYRDSSISVKEIVEDNGIRYYVLYDVTSGQELIKAQSTGTGSYTLYVGDGEARTLLREKNIIWEYSAACPVDMQIYDSLGTLVYTIKDGETVNELCSYGHFMEIEQDGEYIKTATLYEAGYTVKLLGTGEGTMRYSCTISEDDSTETRLIENIPVKEDAVYTTFSSFDDGILQGDLDGDGVVDYNAIYSVPESVTLDKESVDLSFGGTVDLSAAVVPAGALQTVVWESSDTNVAIVDENGTVTAVGSGTADITAFCAENVELTAICSATVSAEEISIEEAVPVGLSASYAYTGSYIEPEFCLEYNGITLEEGLHYTLSFENHVMPGTASITVTGCGIFGGTQTLNFVVEDEVPETVEEKVTRIVQECKESEAETEYAIAMYLHDWLTDHADYDYTMTEYGADGVLLKGTGVCQSYTLAYQLLLDEAGIENIVVSADEMEHAWNIVKIGGSWTHIDCTWDDPNSGGYENHQYFGLSDEEMKQDHTWKYEDYPACYTVVRDISLDELPNPYNVEQQTAGMDYTFVDASGNTLTRAEVGSKNTLLIFGSSNCFNTMSFLKSIKSWKDVLAEQELQVFVVFENKEQAMEKTDSIPFTCVYEQDGGYERYRLLERLGISGSYTYPLLVLQNAQGYVFYYSTGYVLQPEKVLATAIRTLPETEEISSIKLHVYTTQEKLDAAIQEETVKKSTTIKLMSGSEGNLTETEISSVLELLQQYLVKQNGWCSSYMIFGNLMTFTIEYQTTANDSSEDTQIPAVDSLEDSSGHEHTLVSIPAQEATCMYTGRTQGICCADCGAIIVESSEIPKTDHCWSEWETISKADVFSPETRAWVCAVCGERETKTYGVKLSPVMKVTAEQIVLKRRQSTSGFVVSGLADGDYVIGWKSANSKIVKVTGNKNGTCKLTAGKKTGKTTVTITLASGLKKKVTVKVQKETVKTKKVTVGSKKVMLERKKKYTLSVSLYPFTSQEKITYKSSNSAVASVSKKGVITGKKKGKAIITVKSGKKKITCKVIVK